MSMDKIRLAIADDHHVLTDGYTSLLKNHSKIKLLFTVDNGKKLLEQLKIQMVDGVPLLTAFKCGNIVTQLLFPARNWWCLFRI